MINNNIKMNENDITLIMKQTNYTYQEASNKLVVHDFNKENVIREYLGLETKKKVASIKSVNQEIYKQIRKELDFTMSAYNKKNPINVEHAITNFQESEEKRKTK